MTPDRTSRPSGRSDARGRLVRRTSLPRGDAGTATVELALVLPVLLLLAGIAFTGWDAMHRTITLTSAARAGAITAASDLQAGNVSGAKQDALNAINREEGVTNVYQTTNPAADNFVQVLPTPDTKVSGLPINIVTVTISHVATTDLPSVSNINLTVHAVAMYS